MPKKLKDPCQFLLDSGLLFILNHQILHPFGLAMEIKFNDDGTKTLGGIWDYRKEKEGLLFDDETMEIGMAKYIKFLEEFGYKKLEERNEVLGFVHQPMPETKEEINKKPARKMRKIK